jgi:hypothetical protein
MSIKSDLMSPAEILRQLAAKCRANARLRTMHPEAVRELRRMADEFENMADAETQNPRRPGPTIQFH